MSGTSGKFEGALSQILRILICDFSDIPRVPCENMLHHVSPVWVCNA